MNNIQFHINPSKKITPLIDLLVSITDPIYIHTNNKEHANLLDEMLWDNDRFIPHTLQKTAPPSVILIGYQNIPENRIIINASNQQLDLTHIEWVTEHVDLARERYRHWQKKGITLSTHQH